MPHFEIAEIAEIADQYPMTPLQQGMLFHRVHGGYAGVDIEQMVGTLREAIDFEAFRRAWDVVAARNPILRTRFAWEGLERPRQEVMREVTTPYALHDLRALPAGQRDARIAAYLREDRGRGFDLGVAPLWRVAMFRVQDDEQRIVWTFSHLLLDGCVSEVVREVFVAYEALARGEAAPPADERRAYRDHLAFLDEHLPATRDAAKEFFRGMLRGFTTPTGLGALARSDANDDAVYGAKKFRLSRATSDALRAIEGVRPAAIVEGVWGLVLGAFGATEDVVFGVTHAGRRTSVPGAEGTLGLFINTLPTRVRIDPDATIADWLRGLAAQRTAVRPFEQSALVDVLSVAEMARGTQLFDTLLVFSDRHFGSRLQDLGGAWLGRDLDLHDQTSFPCTLLGYGDPELHFKLSYDRRRFDEAAMDRVAALATEIFEAIAREPRAKVGELPRMPEDESHRLLVEWNDTRGPVLGDPCVHRQIADQAKATPSASAVVFRDDAITYAELEVRARRVANRLRAHGVERGAKVGIFVERSIEMVVGLVAILKAGAAYVPLDPGYPTDRIAMMLEDSKVGVVLTLDRLRRALPKTDAHVVAIEDALATGETTPLEDATTGDDLAYVIFTSGSTGRPKGAMIRHRNVTAFFAGMDKGLGTKAGTWLALTSISFDISVLELLWTLARGFTVVVQEEVDKVRREGAPAVDAATRSRKLEFSLFYFAADAAGTRGEAAYRLLLEGAKFADEHGFSAVWTPERHFHPFGGLYPNPAVTSAALAVITKRIALRAGSVVLPLHNPIRCAEEWSVVDNLSNGRVGLSFASGWHASDFALAPQAFADRRRLMAEGIETIRALWRGEAVSATSGDGKPITVRMFPPPVQKEPRIWITSGGSPDTFVMAGKMGASILTNLLVAKEEDMAANIAKYKAAYRAAGHAGEPHVSLMLHTFVGTDLDQVKETVRGPFLEYLRTSTDLINKARWEMTSFARPDKQRQTGRTEEAGRDLNELAKEEIDAIMDHAFERYFTTAGLFGTPRGCMATVDRLKALGVDEVACLIDFGVDPDTVLASLRQLDELRVMANGPRSEWPERDEDFAIPAQIRRHRVTHMQCTPSLAGILTDDPEGLVALRGLELLLLGGEALPESLVDRVKPAIDGRLFNMYGPTETTIWSTCGEVTGARPITLGKPIANTRIYVVDSRLRPTPVGVPGELLIGGAGVVAGYLDRPELTNERFVRDPFSDRADDRLYRTGDLARWRADGTLEFLGRLDHQVKIRGHRIELGEIESALTRHPSVQSAVVVARKDDGDEARLVAYVIPRDGDGSSASEWRAIWDETYASQAKEVRESIFDVAGWNSSYTGEPIPEGEMRAWVDETVSRILGLAPKRVLEIGCGTGLLLFRVAPRCARYVGVDFSREALASIEAKLPKAGLTNVALRELSAENVGAVDETFDTIVLNSVAQYFDGADALAKVIEAGYSRLAPGGAFFLGDIRSLPLLAAFHASIELHRAPDATPTSDLRARIDRRARGERELVIDPAMFPALARVLPDLAAVSIRLKADAHDNELTRFRYDVVLRKAGPGVELRDAVAPAVVAAPLECSLDALRAILSRSGDAVRITGVPDARVREHALAAELLGRGDGGGTAGDLRAQIHARAFAIDPARVADLDPAFTIETTPSARAGTFDLVARRTSAARAVVSFALAPSDTRPWAAFANAPSRAAQQGALGPELRNHLRASLPDFMIPSAFVALDSYPLTPNGKVDRKALPAPDRTRREAATEYTAPGSEVEQVIATVWQDTLSIDRVGADQNFFDLGANSLMMVQVNGRLRSALGRSVSLVDMFRFPTVRALAAHLGDDGAKVDETLVAESADRAQTRRDAMARRRDARQAQRVKG